MQFGWRVVNIGKLAGGFEVTLVECGLKCLGQRGGRRWPWLQAFSIKVANSVVAKISGFIALLSSLVA